MEYQACDYVPLIGLCGNLLQKGTCDDSVLQPGLPQWIKKGCTGKEPSYVSVLSATEARHREKHFPLLPEIVCVAIF